MGTFLTIAIIVGLLLLFIVWPVRVYNNLVKLKNRFQNAFAQIDVQLKRRYDLIPNLVETAKGYMEHEQETLENVIKARNQAQQAEEKASQNPDDAQAMRELSGSEQQLGGALGNFFALSESYPDLKADQNMRQLSEELTSTENRIAYARQAFNDAVMNYNTAREQFPNNLIAGAFNFEEAELFEVESEETREAPNVSF